MFTAIAYNGNIKNNFGQFSPNKHHCRTKENFIARQISKAVLTGQTKFFLVNQISRPFIVE